MTVPLTTYTQPATSSTASSPPTSGCGCGGCPTCHSLQCLCRPRFFAGQLVTDADFRRLDEYLVGKTRLHNRYLHGTGVVCGLEVVCNPCDDTVTVRPGYALGPCGEDIVVCADTRVPVADLIRALRQQRSRDCAPFRDQPADCEATTQRWILNICYDEQPARPVTTLTPRTGACSGGSSGGCSGGCGCSGSTGGSSGCGCGSATPSAPGCGCGSAPGGNRSCGCNSASSATSARTPVGCEPTVICEGFRFTLTKEPAPTPGTRGDTTVTGPLATRVKACLAALTDAISQVPQNPTPADLVQYCCRLKADLRASIETANVHDCTLGRRLADISCPDPVDQQAAPKAAAAITELLRIAIDLYRECVCSALLPPCPDDCCDACVPLAMLTVRSADLQVLDVCNWTSRKFAVTLPMLGYWLGWLPFNATIRQAVSKLCCPPATDASFRMTERLTVSTMQESTAAQQTAAKKAAGTERAGATTGPAEERGPDADPAAWQVAAQYLSGTNPLSGLQATVLASLGATGPNGAVLASPAELTDPFAALALARVTAPAAEALAGPLQRPATDILDRVVARATPDDGRLEALEQAVAALQKKVTSQARTISTLRRGQQK
ncbi:hypothetical protein [Flexivirga alba]|uniref:Uncharacterized protein n=1 Tax=Flexivirga alba TaxID=702742 RepID=A0ABW2AGT5_9MICO